MVKKSRNRVCAKPCKVRMQNGTTEGGKSTESLNDWASEWLNLFVTELQFSVFAWYPILVFFPKLILWSSRRFFFPTFFVIDWNWLADDIERQNRSWSIMAWQIIRCCYCRNDDRTRKKGWMGIVGVRLQIGSHLLSSVVWTFVSKRRRALFINES